MKNRNMKDERISSQRAKINSEAYFILMTVLFASMIVQQFLLDAPFEQYAAEFICFSGMCIYMTVRYLMTGLDIYGDGKRSKYTPLMNSIAAGAVVTVINGTLNYLEFADHYRQTGIGGFIAMLAVTFISCAGCMYAVMSFMYYLNRKKQEKIRKQMDEDEQEE